MKGSASMTDWRTIQIFLEDDGVYELEADSENYQTMRCSCAGFKSGKKCKHTKYVMRRIEEHGGTYAIQIPSDVPDNEVLEAMIDPALFRKFIIDHAKVEVID